MLSNTLRLVSKYSVGTINCSKVTGKNLLTKNNQFLLSSPSTPRLLIRQITLGPTKMSKALVIVADGSEEMEAVSYIIIQNKFSNS